jgi:arabinan endo-1,5-alpha-L-arabinosidase
MFFSKLIGGALAVLSIAPAAMAQYPDPGPVSGDTGAHDPTIIKTPEGDYLMAVTAPNVLLKRSTDRTVWEDAGAVFPQGAPWTDVYRKDDPNLWAPDLSYHDGTYYLYYSASSPGSRKSAIFLATSTTGASGSWTDKGLVVETVETSDHNAIDPNLIVDTEGNWWLNYGSFWGGIKMIAIDPTTGLRSSDQLISLARRTEAGGAVEAPVITRHGDFYYLWVSFDRCCAGADSTYRIMVGRSADITGPYVDRSGRQMMEGGGTEIMASHGNINGPGHQAVFTDEDADVLVYHWYANSGFSSIGINLIRWDDSDWPVVY